MTKFRLRKAAALVLTIAMIISMLVIAPVAIAATPLDAPVNLVLNRGHIESLAFGGPMGLSWDEVEGRETFTVFAFASSTDTDPEDAYAYAAGVDALYLDINDGSLFSTELTDGPFWFRVQANAGEDGGSSALSAAAGPFWYGIYSSDEMAYYPEESIAMWEDETLPVIVVDTRRFIERRTQGHILGDVHVVWANAMAITEGYSHASYQDGIFAAWEDFIANQLTDDMRARLDPAMDYRDIWFFVY